MTVHESLYAVIVLIAFTVKFPDGMNTPEKGGAGFCINILRKKGNKA